MLHRDRWQATANPPKDERPVVIVKRRPRREALT